jgi:hypothetical protein
MLKKTALLPTILLLCGLPLLAELEGDWAVVSESSYGETYHLRLTLKEVDGELSGTLGTPEGPVDLRNIQLQGDELTFEVWIAGSSYSVQAKVDGDEMTGTWRGGGDTGTVKARKTGN